MFHKIACPLDEDYKLWLEFLQLQASPELLDGLGDFLADYLQTSNLKKYVLGLSGGLDSSFLAALLYSRKIPFLGFCLPMAGSLPDEVERARCVAQAYAWPSAADKAEEVHDLTDLYQAFSDKFTDLFARSSPVAEGNIKARIRMIFLYHVAHICQGCVLGTDQLDELLTGFWTLHGDVGDVAPLQLIPKSVEYDLAALLCRRLRDPGPLMSTILAPPTDGLGISVSDFEQLGVESYSMLEDIFGQYFTLCLKAKSQSLSPKEQTNLDNLQKQRPIQLFLRSGFKRNRAMLIDPRSVASRAT